MFFFGKHTDGKYWFKNYFLNYAELATMCLTLRQATSRQHIESFMASYRVRKKSWPLRVQIKFRPNTEGLRDSQRFFGAKTVSECCNSYWL